MKIYQRKLKEQPDLAKPKKEETPTPTKKGKPGYRDSDAK